MRAMPNMIVISACDAIEAEKATLAAAKMGKPVYMRFGREKTPVMTTPETPFEVGKINLVWNSNASGIIPMATIFATGPLLHNALLAARELEGQGIGIAVANVHTIKPIDREKVVELARISGAIVTVEEHQTTGGLGGAIAEVLTHEFPVPMEFIGVHDSFGQSGDPKELIEHYKMGASHIMEAVRKVTNRKV
jgi:transketolase